jgi:hypothetical protein
MSPKLGLPGLVMPHASKLLMMGVGSAPFSAAKPDRDGHPR